MNMIGSIPLEVQGQGTEIMFFIVFCGLIQESKAGKSKILCFPIESMKHVGSCRPFKLRTLFHLWLKMSNCDRTHKRSEQEKHSDCNYQRYIACTNNSWNKSETTWNNNTSSSCILAWIFFWHQETTTMTRGNKIIPGKTSLPHT